MKYKWLILIVLFIAVGAGTFGLCRYYCGKGQSSCCGMANCNMSCCAMEPYLCKQLCLSPEQTKGLSELDKDFDAKKEAYEEKVDKDRQKISDLLDASRIDKKEVSRVIRVFNQDRSDLEIASLGHILKVQKLLKPDQKKQFVEMLKKSFE